MPDELPYRELGRPRLMTDTERDLMLFLVLLARKANQELVVPSDPEMVVVREMLDSGMGSLYLIQGTRDPSARRFAGRVAELQFSDTDGIPVLTSLNVDQDRLLFELDVWRADFRKVLDLDRWRLGN